MFDPDKVDKQALRAAVVVQARSEGCTCEPWVELPDIKRGAMRIVSVRHDDDCPRCDPRDGTAEAQELRQRVNAGEFDQEPTLVPVTDVGPKGPPPSLEELKASGEAMFAAYSRGEFDFEPTEEEESALRSAQETLDRATRDDTSPYTSEVARKHDAASAGARLGLMIASMRIVRQRCRHVDWPPTTRSQTIMVLGIAKAAICHRPECLVAALNVSSDDGLCELCEQPSDTFTPAATALGPVHTHLQLCDACADFILGDRRPA